MRALDAGAEWLHFDLMVRTRCRSSRRILGACSATQCTSDTTLLCLVSVMGYIYLAHWWLTASLSSTGADVLLQDAHFVDNWTFGPCIVKAVHRHIRRQRRKEVFCDCHLYATAPEDWVEVRATGPAFWSARLFCGAGLGCDYKPQVHEAVLSCSQAQQ